MSDDALISASDREVFEAIVSQMLDPEVAHLRRIFVALSATLFLLGAIGVTVVGGLGWAGFASFSVTFLSGLVLARRVYLPRLSASTRI